MSNLTLGCTEAFTGNPLKAMRYKRRKQFINETKTKEGHKVFQEKGIIELFDEFNKINLNDDQEEYSPNLSVDSFEIDNYREEDEEKEKWESKV